MKLWKWEQSQIFSFQTQVRRQKSQSLPCVSMVSESLIHPQLPSKREESPEATMEDETNPIPIFKHPTNW